MSQKPIQTDEWDYQDRGMEITTFLVCLIPQSELLSGTGEMLLHWFGLSSLHRVTYNLSHHRRASGAYITANNLERSTIFDTYKDSVADRVINIQQGDQLCIVE